VAFDLVAASAAAGVDDDLDPVTLHGVLPMLGYL